MSSTMSHGTTDVVPDVDGHVCLVVDDDATYPDLASPFLARGEARRQKTIAFGPEDSPALELLRPLAATVGDPYADILGRRPLDAESLFAALRSEAASALEQGYTGLRVAADMDWVLPAIRRHDDALRFDILLDRLLLELDVTVLCAYRRTSFGSEAIQSVLCTHPVTAGHRDAAPSFKFVAGDDGVWVLSGELDLTGVPLLLPALRAAAGSSWVVDVSRLTFADLSGMRALATAAVYADETLELRGMSETMLRYWQVAGFDRFASRVRVG